MNARLTFISALFSWSNVKPYAISRLKKVFFLAAFFVFLTFLFFSFAAQAQAVTVSWTGSAGNSLWASSTNWSTNAVPDAGDDVIINASTTVLLSASTTVNSLTLGSTTAATSTTLTFNYDAYINGPLTVTNDVHIYNGIKITHSAGTTVVVGRVNLNIGGDLTVHAGGSIDVSGKGYGLTSGPGAGSGTSVPSDSGSGGEGRDLC